MFGNLLTIRWPSEKVCSKEFEIHERRPIHLLTEREYFVRNVTIDDKWSCAFQMALKKFTSARSLCLYVQVQSRLNKLNQALRSLVLYKKILSVNVYKYSKP